MIDNDDPARLEIAARAEQLAQERGITGDPDAPSHFLGEITLADGKVVRAHVVHAVDPIITDGNEVVMINRRYPPGLGKPCLPGGFIDPSKDPEGRISVESAVAAAARESMEEVGISLVGGNRVGIRKFNRPFDVRVAQTDLPQFGIKKDDIFTVSTQAVLFNVENLKTTHLVAGDDAEPGSARRVVIHSLKKDNVGIPDHFDMIREAFPEKFIWIDRLRKRPADQIER